MQMQLRNCNGGITTVSSDAFASFQQALRGAVIRPEEPGYDAARSVWNGMIDRRPAMIAQAAGAADVMRTVSFAREHGALLAVRGGGHNIAGNAVCDGGVTLNLSNMRSVHIDPASRRARVEGGATLGDVDKEAQAFGLCVPVGINSTTGIAGLTLGGGFGWTSRKLGLTIDNLESVDIVTSDGQLLRADSQQHPDLFWAVRGGGGNFGVVTSFEFNLHTLGPDIISGLLLYPLQDAAKLLPEYRRLALEAPDEMTCWVVLRKAPPAPFIPEAWHGKEVMILALCYCGSVAAGEEAAAPFRALGAPILDLIGPHKFAAWQSAFDPLLAPGVRNYWKSHDFHDLSEPVQQILLDAVWQLPTDECEAFIAHLGGQVSRVPDASTAFARRAIPFLVNVHTRWREPADDDRCIGWARGLFDSLTPHAAGTVYVNFMPDDETDRVRSAYGPNYEKLAAVKRRYDPDNFFRLNQNIRA